MITHTVEEAAVQIECVTLCFIQITSRIRRVVCNAFAMCRLLSDYSLHPGIYPDAPPDGTVDFHSLPTPDF